MAVAVPESLAIIAGRGVYPLLLAESARKQGVKRLFVAAFKGETEPRIAALVDEVRWLHLGQLQALLDTLGASGIKQAVMAGQITPTRFFQIRMDKPMLDLLMGLRVRNAETVYGAVGRELGKVGVELMPASRFMEYAMPDPGVLTTRAPSEQERADIELGLKVATLTSGLDIGQTVVVREGVILAVEAFEGTDEAIARAGKLGGPGAVVVKVAKRGHDMRFDIPVVGIHTMKSLKKSKAAVLAVEAKRTILLERERIVTEADRMGLCLVAVQKDG